MSTPPSSSSSSDNLILSFCWFAFWWLIILGVHLVTCAYNAIYAMFYSEFGDTVLSFLLQSHGVGMPLENYATIAITHIVLAVVHGVCVLSMLIGSLWQQTLVFSLWPKAEGKNSTTIGNKLQSRERVPGWRGYRVASAVLKLMKRIVGRHGLLGVNGKYFHALQISRELLETILQTIQAVRMSKYLPRTLLNRFYVILLVINCWSSVLIYSRWFEKDEARRRFVSIVCDSVLDAMSAMGVTIIVTLSYIGEYNFEVTSFNSELLMDMEWIARMLNEARMILVASWFDLLGHIVFSLALVSTTSDMKQLLHCIPRSGNKIRHAGKNRLVSTGSLGLTGVMCDDAQIVAMKYSYNLTGLRSQTARSFLLGAHLVFAAWGFAILVMHIHASLQTPLVECSPKVRPMAGALPSCFVVNFNCHELGVSAEKNNVIAEWAKFDRSTSMKLQILHCSAVEIPETICDFSRLREIAVYNSSIEHWNIDTAVTNSQHPVLKKISIVRSNMTDGLLPLGLQSLDFPQWLYEIYFCQTIWR